MDPKQMIADLDRYFKETPFEEIQRVIAEVNKKYPPEYKKKKIYLDDVRTPVDKDNWVVVRNYNEFVAMVQFIGLENIDIISLDHDLGESSMIEYYNNVKKNYQLDYSNIEEKTGYDCAKWLVQNSILTDTPIPTIYTHSANPIGSANIMGYINNYLMNCNLPQTCVRVQIEHIIEEQFILSPEERQAKWQKQY